MGSPTSWVPFLPGSLVCELHCLVHLLCVLLVSAAHGLEGVSCSAHSQDPLHLLERQVLCVVAIVLLV